MSTLLVVEFCLVQGEGKAMQAFPINPKGIYVRPNDEKIEKHSGFHPQPRHVGNPPYPTTPHSPTSSASGSALKVESNASGDDIEGKRRSSIEAHTVDLIGDEEPVSPVSSHPLPPGEMRRVNVVPSRPVQVPEQD